MHMPPVLQHTEHWLPASKQHCIEQPNALSRPPWQYQPCKLMTCVLMCSRSPHCSALTMHARLHPMMCAACFALAAFGVCAYSTLWANACAAMVMLVHGLEVSEGTTWCGMRTLLTDWYTHPHIGQAPQHDIVLIRLINSQWPCRDLHMANHVHCLTCTGGTLLEQAVVADEPGRLLGPPLEPPRLCLTTLPGA